MTNSIIRDHTKSTIQSYNSGKCFILNNYGFWIPFTGNIIKTYDKTIDEIISTYKNKWENYDLVLSHKSVTNLLSYSENFEENKISDSNYDKKYWNTTSMTLGSSTFNMPELMNEAPSFLPKAKDNTEKNIYQVCYPNTYRQTTSSMFIHYPYSTLNRYVSLTLFNTTYNFGVSVIVNINDYKSKSLGIHDISPIIIDSTFKTITDTKITSMVSNMVGKIEKLTYNSKDYYRLSVSATINCGGGYKLQFNQLGNNKEVIWSSSESDSSFRCFISGFQMEQDVTTPSFYICSLKKNKTTLRLLDKVYRVVDKTLSNPLEETNGKVYYPISYKSIEKEYNTDYEFTPDIKSPHVGDVAIIREIVSFSNKTQSSIVTLGYSTNSTDNMGSIHYDYNSSNYFVKNGNDDKPFKVLKSNKSHNMKIIHAMTLNQGEFETWSQQAKPTEYVFEHGFNTGGGYNFYFINKLMGY